MLVRRRRLAHVHVQAAEAGVVRQVGLLRHIGVTSSSAAASPANASTARGSASAAAVLSVGGRRPASGGRTVDGSGLPAGSRGPGAGPRWRRLRLLVCWLYQGLLRVQRGSVRRDGVLWHRGHPEADDHGADGRQVPGHVWKRLPCERASGWTAGSVHGRRLGLGVLHRLQRQRGWQGGVRPARLRHRQEHWSLAQRQLRRGHRPGLDGLCGMYWGRGAPHRLRSSACAGRIAMLLYGFLLRPT